MSNINPNLISAIVAVAAIISPVITTIINNRYQLKLKKLEAKQLEYERTTMYKRNIFENYLKYLSALSHSFTIETRQNYSEWYPLAYMYLPKEVQKTMAELNLLIGKTAVDQVIKYVDLLTIDISKELNKL